MDALSEALSAVRITSAIFFDAMRFDPDQPRAVTSDRFVLSKGHGCAGLYAVLAERGFFPIEWLEDFYQDGSHLAGHITHVGVPGVDASTGALGHGLSIACGMALAGKQDRRTELLARMNEPGFWED